MLTLCAEGQPRQPAASAGKTRARVREAPEPAWTLEPHVCRHCFGRLVSTPWRDGQTRYACSNCGAEAAGPTPAVLCSCGMRLRSAGAMVDAGLRCQPNPAPSAAFPSLFVAAEVPKSDWPSGRQGP